MVDVAKIFVHGTEQNTVYFACNFIIGLLRLLPNGMERNKTKHHALSYWSQTASLRTMHGKGIFLCSIELGVGRYN